MTHQTVLDEDPDFPLAPDSPLLFDNNTDPRGDPAVLPPTPESKRWKTSSKNLLASFYREYEKEGELNLQAQDSTDITFINRSPVWQHQPPYAQYRGADRRTEATSVSPSSGYSESSSGRLSDPSPVSSRGSTSSRDDSE